MKKLLPLALLPILASTGSAQAPIVPFTGDFSDGFETQTAFMFTPCVIPDVFSGNGDLCTPGNSGAHITSGWGFMCNIFPHSGSRLFGSAGGYAEYTFNSPVSEFGGYFGTNNGTADGVANFFGPGGLIGTATITAPADCTWTWNGWSDTSGTGFTRIEIHSNAFGGAFMDMDDMEITLLGGGGGTGTPVCFGDGSGAACGCGNETTGEGGGCRNTTGASAVLSASGSADTTNDTVVLNASGVINNTGLFFQGNNTINGGTGVTFGDGIRCCGDNVVRLGIVTGSGNQASSSVTITNQGAPGTIQPGDKKCYQYWYRDPAGGGVCGSTFNLSNAVTITWS